MTDDVPADDVPDQAMPADDVPLDEPVPEHPATWENVVAGEAKKLTGEALGDHDLAERGEEQIETAHEVSEEFREEHEPRQEHNPPQ